MLATIFTQKLSQNITSSHKLVFLSFPSEFHHEVILAPSFEAILNTFRIFIVLLTTLNVYLANIYLIKVSNGNTRTICKICSKLTIKTPERHRVLVSSDFKFCSCVFIVDFNQINTGCKKVACLEKVFQTVNSQVSKQRFQLQRFIVS